MTVPENFQFPWRDGNQFSILIDGPEFFPRMLDALDSAQHYILLEMYLFESGTIASKFIDAFLRAASRDVRIYLLLDDYGALGLTNPDRIRLAHPNIQIIYYNPLHSRSALYNLYRIVWRHAERLLYRDHRKLLVVDGEVAFTGGVGITDDFDPPLDSEMRWRETVVEIHGPVVIDWIQLFLETWNRNDQQLQLKEHQVPAQIASGQLGRVTVNEIGHRRGTQRSLIRRLDSSEHRIWFATAYFIPPWRIRRKLKRAARKAVDVRLLLPGPITDHPSVRYASHRFYARLLKNGVRIFEYQPRFLHAKTVLCDNWVTIGSSNFDRWNLQWNLEANQEIDDQNIADRVQQIFENDFASSVEYTYDKWHRRSWYSRLLEWFWKKVEILSMRIRKGS